jgi:hypothetical protein
MGKMRGSLKGWKQDSDWALRIELEMELYWMPASPVLDWRSVRKAPWSR